MAEIRALGHIPRDHRGLAQRVRRALRQSLLSDSQLAELAELHASNRPSKRRELSTAQRMETLMAEIRALGHIPRRQPRLADEYALASRLHDAKRKSLLSESQLAELAELSASDSREVRLETLMGEIRALGHIPRVATRSEG